MSLPKADSVAQLFREHPECWTQHSYFRDANDERCNTPTNAAKCCFSGAIWAVYGDGDNFLSSSEYNRAKALTHDAVCLWNDADCRTISEVIDLAEKAGV